MVVWLLAAFRGIPVRFVMMSSWHVHTKLEATIHKKVKHTRTYTYWIRREKLWQHKHDKRKSDTLISGGIPTEGGPIVGWGHWKSARKVSDVHVGDHVCVSAASLNTGSRSTNQLLPSLADLISFLNPTDMTSQTGPALFVFKQTQ